MRKRVLTATSLAGCLLLASCAGHTADGAPSSGATAPAAVRPPARPVTKVLVFVAENHSLDQMRSEMPRSYALAKEYGYATAYQGITHPSLPNYLTIAAGDARGVTDDDPPSDHPLQGPSIFARALQAGKTAGLYADGMPTACDTSSSGRYAVKHNPWAYFPAERTACRQFDVPVSALDAAVSGGQLPNVGMVIPDLCHDAHDCSLADADTWIADRLATVMAGPDWASGHLAIVITADEDDDHTVPDTDNRVLTVVLHGTQRHHVVAAPLDHRSLYGLFEDVIGVPHTEPSSVGSMAQAFGLPLPH